MLHALAQVCHCAAQGKVGSGFDVSAAVYGSHRYCRFSPALLQVALRANKVFGTKFEERKTHWHGWRHSTPCNWMELVPKPTLAEICLWCRMTEKTVLLYLKHNGVGGDTSNRTDQISGAQTLSISAIGAWCAMRNRQVDADRIGTLIKALGLGDVDNFLACDVDALLLHLRRITTVTLGEEEALSHGPTMKKFYLSVRDCLVGSRK